MTELHPRLPFTVLGGYLGAGKTTLLNRLLATTTRRLVVLLNDVGAVNVDAALVAEHDGATLTLTNGCVCCAIADDLGPALERVRELAAGPAPPDQVVLELSGVAEPARVAPWAATTGFRLDGIVVCADADQIVELCGRRFVADTVRAQLAAADLVLLTKTDLAPDGGAGARRFVASVTDAPIIDAIDHEPSVVFGSGGREVPAVDSPSDNHRTDLVPVVGMSRAEVRALVDGLPSTVIRAKGVVRCIDADTPIEIQVVGRRRALRERTDLVGTAPPEVVDTLVTIHVPDA